LDGSTVRPAPFGGRRVCHAVDGLLADERVGAGVEVEGEELAGLALGILAFGVHDLSDPAIVIALNS
jgi:hypothetical protein